MNMSPDLAAGWAAALVVAVGFGLRPRPPSRIIRSRAPLASAPSVSRRVAPHEQRRASHVPGSDAVAAWCDRLARAARTGSPLLSALREVEPPDGLSDRFAEVSHDLDRGQPLDQAFGHLPSHPDLDLAVTALLACRANGIDPAPPLEQVATVLRWRAADAAELRSQSAQARASSKVMTVLPLVMLGLLVATSEMVRSAVTTPIGLIAAMVGMALNLTGWMWMRGLIERAIR